MHLLRASALALLVACAGAAPAAAATPVERRSALTVTSLSIPATVVSGELLSVKVRIGNRGERSGSSHAEVILVPKRGSERRLPRVVVKAIKPDRSELVTLKPPVAPVGLTGSWKVKVCADAKRAFSKGRRGACRASRGELRVLPRPPASAGAGAPLPGPLVAGTTTPGGGGAVLPLGPPVPTPPAPPAPDWKLEMTPNPLVLGTLAAGDEDAPDSERPFVITNTGTAKAPAFMVGDYGFQSGQIASTFMTFGASDSCRALNPGESCSGDMWWSPRGSGDLTGRIALFRPATSGPLAYEEFQSFPFLADHISRAWASADDLTFTVGNSREFILTVGNDGDVSAMFGLNAPLQAASPSGTCSVGPIGPGESCTLIRKACGLAGSTTQIPYSFTANAQPASHTATLTLKVAPEVSVTC